MRVCEDKGKLSTVFTQNIDGLDYQALPKEKVVPVHGSLAKAECEGCKTPHDFGEFQDKVRDKIRDIYKKGPEGPEVSENILCKECKMPLVKPATVLYGRSLPDEYHERLTSDLPLSDALVVVGTSLTVAPACLLPFQAPGHKILVNAEETENPGWDVELIGKADEKFATIACELGWLKG